MTFNFNPVDLTKIDPLDAIKVVVAMVERGELMISRFSVYKQPANASGDETEIVFGIRNRSPEPYYVGRDLVRTSVGEPAPAKSRPLFGAREIDME